MGMIPLLKNSLYHVNFFLFPAKRKDDEVEDDEEDISSDEGGSKDDVSDFDEMSEDGASDDEDAMPSKKRKIDDDEDEFGDDFGELSDEDAEVLEFDDEDDNEVPSKKKKKMKVTFVDTSERKDEGSGLNVDCFQGDGDFGPSSSVFASSEKFAELIEATAAAGPSGGTDDIINKDNSRKILS